MTEEKKKRGFAAMTPERQREIASKGGKSVAAENRSFSRDPLLAAAAGQKGGLAMPDAERAFSTDPDLARRAGRLGGLKSRGGTGAS